MAEIVGAESVGGDSNTLTVPVPAGTTDGDVLVAFESTDWGSYANMTDPSGFSFIVGRDNGSNGGFHVKVWGRVASSEPASYAFHQSSSDGCATIVTVRGVTLDGAVSAVSSAMSSPWVAPSLSGTTAAAGVLLCLAGVDGNFSSASWTPPAGMTEQADVQSTSFTTHSVATLIGPPSPTGPRTFTVSGAVGDEGGIQASVWLADSGGTGPVDYPTDAAVVPVAVELGTPAVQRAASTAASGTGTAVGLGPVSGHTARQSTSQAVTFAVGFGTPSGRTARQSTSHTLSAATTLDTPVARTARQTTATATGAVLSFGPVATQSGQTTTAQPLTIGLTAAATAAASRRTTAHTTTTAIGLPDVATTSAATTIAHPFQIPINLTPATTMAEYRTFSEPTTLRLCIECTPPAVTTARTTTAAPLHAGLTFDPAGQPAPINWALVEIIETLTTTLPTQATVTTLPDLSTHTDIR